MVPYLQRRQGRVDRHRNGTAGQDGQVRHEPLRPALGDDRHAIARLHTHLAKPERDIANGFEELLARQAGDLAAAHAPHHQRLRDPPQDMEWQVRDRLNVDLGLFRNGDGECHGRIIVGSRWSAVAVGSQYPALLSTTFSSV